MRAGANQRPIYRNFPPVAACAPATHRLVLSVGVMLCILFAQVDTCYALRVRIRARAALTTEAFRSRGLLLVRGNLTDSRGKRVSGASVAVSIRSAKDPKEQLDDSFTRAALTSQHGLYEARFAIPERLRKTTRWRIVASFAGHATVGRTTVDREVDVAKPQAKLAVELKPSLLTTDVRSLEVAVSATVLDIPLVKRAIKLRLDDKPFAVVQTGEDGWAVQQVPTVQLMPRGRHVVSFYLPETDDHNAAEAQAIVEVRSATLVTLTLWEGTSKKPCDARQLCFQGGVLTMDPNGGEEPAARSTVVIHANKQRLLTLVCDAKGMFKFRLRADRARALFGGGDIGVVAEARPAGPYRQAGWSQVRVVRAAAPQPLSPWFYFGVLGLVGLGLLVRRLLDRRREKGLAQQLAEVSAGLPLQSIRRVGAGGVEFRQIRGVVLHGETGRVAPATVSLAAGEKDHIARSIETSNGAFHFSDIDDGDWTIRVEVAQHEPLHLTVTVPHDGTFDGCELLPRSHRAIVRSAFGEMMRHKTGKDVDWQCETPQTAEPRWLKKARRGHAEVRSAVMRVDRALYGRETTAADVKATREELHRAGDVAK